MASKKTIIRGDIFKPRLFIDSSGKASLLEYPATSSSSSGSDLSTYTCQIAAKKKLSDLAYALDPITGTPGATGYLDFTIDDALTASLVPGTYVVEILWTSAGGDEMRYQFSLIVTERVINAGSVPAAPVDARIENFGGMAGTPITVNEAFDTYCPVVMPIGQHHGKVGDIEVTVDSKTQFTVRNSGSSRGQFKWRIL